MAPFARHDSDSVDRAQFAWRGLVAGHLEARLCGAWLPPTERIKSDPKSYARRCLNQMGLDPPALKRWGELISVFEASLS